MFCYFSCLPPGFTNIHKHAWFEPEGLAPVQRQFERLFIALFYFLLCTARIHKHSQAPQLKRTSRQHNHNRNIQQQQQHQPQQQHQQQVMQNNNQPLLPTSAAERPHYYDHVHGDRALSSAASAGMRRCYQEGVLCDVALRVGSRVVHCHRLVLAGSSDFFRCLFTSEFKEKDQPEIDLSASFKNFSALKSLVDAMYGMPIQFGLDTVGDVVEGARFMLFDEGAEEGRLFLLRNLTVANSILTLLVALELNLADVASVASSLVVVRLEDTLCHTDDTLRLTPPQLYRLLRHGITRFTRKEAFQAFLGRLSEETLLGLGEEEIERAHFKASPAPPHDQQAVSALVHQKDVGPEEEGAPGKIINALYALDWDRWLSWPAEHFPPLHHPVLVMGDRILLRRGTALFLCRCDEPERLTRLPSPPAHSGDLVWSELFCRNDDELWLLQMVYVSGMQGGRPYLVDAHSCGLGEPDNLSWRYRGILTTARRPLRFCGIQKSHLWPGWFYLFLKWDRQVDVMLYWETQSTWDTVFLPELTEQSPVRHCQPCVVGGPRGDRIIVAANREVYKLDQVRRVWEPLSKCQDRSCQGHLVSVDCGLDYAYYYHHVALNEANQILLHSDDRRSPPTPVPLGSLGRCTGGVLLSPRLRACLRPARWQGDPNEPVLPLRPHAEAVLTR